MKQASIEAKLINLIRFWMDEHGIKQLESQITQKCEAVPEQLMKLLLSDEARDGRDEWENNKVKLFFSHHLIHNQLELFHLFDFFTFERKENVHGVKVTFRTPTLEIDSVSFSYEERSFNDLMYKELEHVDPILSD